jgi:hypothetical protein
MFNSREYVIDDLTKAILDGLISDELYFQAKQKAETIKAEKEQQRQRTAEEYKKRQIEKMRFENRYPKAWQYKHVYLDELTACCNESPLTDMQTFANEMQAGKHKGEFFKGSFFDALSYLTARINDRINDNPLHDEKVSIAKAKDDLAKRKTTLEIKAEQVQKVHDKAKDLLKELHPDPTQKTKAYTA